MHPLVQLPRVDKLSPFSYSSCLSTDFSSSDSGEEEVARGKSPKIYWQAAIFKVGDDVRQVRCIFQIYSSSLLLPSQPMDHYTFLGNCPPTPRPSQRFALLEK